MRRKDDQLAAMLKRMDVKDKQMTELIMQVAAMKTGGCYTREDNDDDTDNDSTNNARTSCNRKRKAADNGNGGNSSLDSGDGNDANQLNMQLSGG